MYDEFDPDHQVIEEKIDNLTQEEFYQALYDGGYGIRYFNSFEDIDTGVDLVHTHHGKRTVLNGAEDKYDTMPYQPSIFLNKGLPVGGTVSVVDHHDGKALTSYHYDNEKRLWRRDSSLPGHVAYRYIVNV